jgi:hypothetical protein
LDHWFWAVVLLLLAIGLTKAGRDLRRTREALTKAQDQLGETQEALAKVQGQLHESKLSLASYEGERDKLKIHSAWYGDGPATDVDVAPRLRTLPLGGLVIQVKNNTPVDRDPAPGQYKRLRIKYSYLNDQEWETSQEEYGRLVVPENLPPPERPRGIQAVLLEQQEAWNDPEERNFVVLRNEFEEMKWSQQAALAILFKACSQGD